eukprot:scaffold282199_cov18-Tisochrysis_lutea.AAC.1
MDWGLAEEWYRKFFVEHSKWSKQLEAADTSLEEGGSRTKYEACSSRKGWAGVPLLHNHAMKGGQRSTCSTLGGKGWVGVSRLNETRLRRRWELRMQHLGKVGHAQGFEGGLGSHLKMQDKAGECAAVPALLFALLIPRCVLGFHCMAM